MFLGNENTHQFEPRPYDDLNDCNLFIGKFSSGISFKSFFLKKLIINKHKKKIKKGLLNSGFIADQALTSKYQDLMKYITNPNNFDTHQLKHLLLSIPLLIGSLQNRAHKWLSKTASYPLFSVNNSYFVYQANPSNIINLSGNFLFFFKNNKNLK